MKYFVFSLTLLIALLFVNQNSFSQAKIAVQLGDEVSFYSNLDTAITSAPSGATVYIPSGNFALNVVINKKLYIYGVGHYPDTSNAASRTIISKMTVVTGADSGSVSGIYINGDFIFGTTDNNSIVNNYSITRCSIFYLYSIRSNLYNNTSTNLYIAENVFRNISDDNIVLKGSQNSIIEKNIFNGLIRFVSSNCNIRNNIFLGRYSTELPLGSLVNCNIYNNIFIRTYNTFQPIGCSNLNFYNNIFVQSYITSFPGTGNIQNNNLFGINLDSLFENQTGTTFDYNHNYHLKSTCLGKNFGTDGTDVGIYGTTTPYKEFARPAIPYIRSVSIPNETVNGYLPVNIEVEAQPR